jgi:hypothetical protein
VDYVRSVRALSAELKNVVEPREVAAPERPAGLIAEPPQPIAVVGVHGISPIQQYAFQDQFATGLLAYLNARDDLRYGAQYEERRDSNDRRSATPSEAPPVPDRRTGKERRSGSERRARTETVTPDRRRVKQRWFATPYWPRVSRHTDDPVLKPSALRLHQATEEHYERPTTQVYDVYEGYWSPLSKGKTQLASAMLWLLRCTFLATSSTARIPATWRKLCWDLGYVFAALGLVLSFFIAAAFVGARAWTNFLGLFHPQDPAPSFWTFASEPFRWFAVLPWYAWAHLTLIVVLAYLLVQLIQLGYARYTGQRRKTELLKDSGSHGHFRQETIAAGKFHRVLTILFVVVFVLLAIADFFVLDLYYDGDPYGVIWEGALLVLTVGLVQTGRWLAGFVVENILGDVQIYTTHDSNSTFYGIRQQIIATVTNAVLGAVNAVDIKFDEDGNALKPVDVDGVTVPDPPLYGKIHVAGHSLGSTIAMDVLLRIRQLSYEGAVSEDAWGRVRSLTTFGTALEKTRFLLDVRNPTVSAAQQQWQNDAYGRFFTLDPSTLAHPDNTHGIFWGNLWYGHDVVANRIVSYKSVVKPGTMSFGWLHGPSKEHAICLNELIPHPRPPFAFVHGDYIGDVLFWKSVGPRLTT